MAPLMMALYHRCLFPEVGDSPESLEQEAVTIIVDVGVPYVFVVPFGGQYLHRDIEDAPDQSA